MASDIHSKHYFHQLKEVGNIIRYRDRLRPKSCNLNNSDKSLHLKINHSKLLVLYIAQLIKMNIELNNKTILMR